MRFKLLLDYEKLNHSPYSEITLPYSYTIRCRNQILYYFGGNHSHDKTNPQYRKLQSFWRKFIKQVNPENAIVLVEDGPHTPDKNIEEAVYYGGENGYVTFLNRKLKISIECPEPSYKEQVLHLNKKYSREKIILFFFIRALAQWHRSEIKRRRIESMNLYLTKKMRRYKSEFPWSKYSYTVNQMEKVFKKIYSKSLKSLSESSVNDLLFPSRESPMNKIANSLNQFRDYRILRRIEKHWRMGKSIFIVYGGSHAVVQKPVISDFANCSKSA